MDRMSSVILTYRCRLSVSHTNCTLLLIWLKWEESSFYLMPPALSIALYSTEELCILRVVIPQLILVKFKFFAYGDAVS